MSWFWRWVGICCLAVLGIAIATPLVYPVSQEDLFLRMYLLGLALFVAIATFVFRLIKMANDRR